MIKMTQKNYEAIKIYNQKEKIFTLKGEIQSLKRENEKLKKQLEIAVCTLENYADTQNWRDIFEEDGDDSEYHTEALYFADEGYESAQSALKEIKELDK